jgi:hypothetical protein
VPEPPAAVQVLAEEQINRLRPAGELVLKNVSPTAQVEGNADPDRFGFVQDAEEKSTFLPCAAKSTRVCAGL